MSAGCVRPGSAFTTATSTLSETEQTMPSIAKIVKVYEPIANPSTEILTGTPDAHVPVAFNVPFRLMLYDVMLVLVSLIVQLIVLPVLA